MRKLQHIVLSFCLILSLFFYPSVEADAASVSLGVSASTVNIGDKVTVSVTVPESMSATIDLTFSSDVLSFSKASADVNANGSTITMNVGKYSLAASNTISITFKAKTSGTASLNASVVSAVDNDTAEEVSLDGASTSVTVENTAPEPENPPTEPENPPTEPENPPTEPEEPSEEPKSADNSLSKLKLSSGTLSPSFKYNVTNYTATVGYNVTSVVVSATPSNAKATIVSVTGNGNVNLEVGKNTIQVVVQAENGVKATYTIVVTREEEGTDTPNPPTSETDPESETTPESENELGLEWNGQKLQPATDIPNDLIPADFSKNTLVINSVEVPCITFANADLKVLYLTNEEGAAGFYVYDEAQQSIYPFVKLESNNNYIIVLLPDEENVPAPENYKACTLSIEGKGVINAYQFVEPVDDAETTSWFAPETFYAAPATASDFYLVYGMNSAGETNWYVYDSVEGTIQRYVGSVQNPIVETEPETEINTETTESNENTEKYDDLLAELEAAENMKLIIICVAVFIVAVLVIIIVNLVLRGRDEEFFEDEEFDEEDDEEYAEEYDFEEAEDTKGERNHAIEDSNMTMESEDDEIEIEFYEMPREEQAVEDDDEIEIEFYEMTENLSQTETKESDEVEVEFYDMEALLMKEAIAPYEETSKKEKEIPVKKQTFIEEDDDDLEFIELD
ncbi:MAG: cadherin-like beta sandwich domain-containing protein [Agathobacter sp.]|nr:cadherin-like beta sandwich domain-containing protein [Agathobacter sp.]